MNDTQNIVDKNGINFNVKIDAMTIAILAGSVFAAVTLGVIFAKAITRNF